MVANAMLWSCHGFTMKSVKDFLDNYSGRNQTEGFDITKTRIANMEIYDGSGPRGAGGISFHQLLRPNSKIP